MNSGFKWDTLPIQYLGQIANKNDTCINLGPIYTGEHTRIHSYPHMCSTSAYMHVHHIRETGEGGRTSIRKHRKVSLCFWKDSSEQTSSRGICTDVQPALPRPPQPYSNYLQHQTLIPSEVPKPQSSTPRLVPDTFVHISVYILLQTFSGNTVMKTQQHLSPPGACCSITNKAGDLLHCLQQLLRVLTQPATRGFEN